MEKPPRQWAERHTSALTNQCRWRAEDEQRCVAVSADVASDWLVRESEKGNRTGPAALSNSD